MNSKLEVVPYSWNGHSCYIGKVFYKDLPGLIDIRSDISMNRKVDSKRVDGIIKYILSDIQSTFFPPTIFNSKANLTFIEPNILQINNGKLTIIDGQHRVNAIIKLMGEVRGVERDQLKMMELPVLIIEGLENYQHRDLFYMINETPKSVESNVSERFAPKLENLLGLKFFSENKHLIESVEWHEKQSKEKVVYLHITDCIRELNKILYHNLKDWYECDRDLLYKEDTYVEITNFYLENYFELLSASNNKTFYRKKITLRALVESAYNEIENLFKTFNPSTLEEAINKIKEIIEMSMSNLFQDLLIEYKGSENVKKDVFSSIRTFLTVNSKLHNYRQIIVDNPNVKLLIMKFLEPYYLNNILKLSDIDISSIDQTFFELISNKDNINEIEYEKLEELSINKNTAVHLVLSSFVREESV